MWDVDSGRLLNTLTGHSDWVNCVAVIDDERIVSGSSDKTLIIWNVDSRERIHTLYDSSVVRCVAVINGENGEKIISGCDNGTLKIWDFSLGEEINTLTGHQGSVSCVAVIDNDTIVSGSLDQSLKIWDVESGRAITTLTGHEGSVTCVAVTDENKIISGSHDNSLKIWSLPPTLVKGFSGGYGGSGRGGSGFDT